MDLVISVTNFPCPLLQAFSLDFNLKAHMKTHSADNYHACQYPECGRRFTQESKLRAHIRAQHEKVRFLTSASKFHL
jgi:uncharacterized Zn-finger protein